MLHDSCLDSREKKWGECLYAPPFLWRHSRSFDLKLNFNYFPGRGSTGIVFVRKIGVET